MRKCLLLYVILLIFLVVLTSCANSQKLGESKGPIFVINPDHWTPSPADMIVENDQ